MSGAAEIKRRAEELAAEITERHFSLHPELDAKYGEIGRQKCLEDARYHLSYVSEAVRLDAPALFADYIGWAASMLAGRGIPAEDLEENLRIIEEVIEARLTPEAAGGALKIVRSAREGLPSVSHQEHDWLEGRTDDLAELARNYLRLLLIGKRVDASRIILEAVENGASIRDIYLEVFQRSQREIGRLWQLNRITVAHEHYCTAATQMIMSQLYPKIFASERNGRSMVATCVGGELHEIGVRMVADFFELNGWDSYYLGSNVPADSVRRALIERRAELLAISATMTFHLPKVTELIEAVRKDPELRNVRIMVGGYPFLRSENLYRQIGADGFAVSAEDAVRAAAGLVRGES